MTQILGQPCAFQVLLAQRSMPYTLRISLPRTAGRTWPRELPGADSDARTLLDHGCIRHPQAAEPWPTQQSAGAPPARIDLMALRCEWLRLPDVAVDTATGAPLLTHRVELALLAVASEDCIRAGADDDHTVVAWGDNSVSSCRSYGRAKGPGASAGAFPTARSLSGEGPRGPRRCAKGSCGTPGTP